MDNHPVSVSTPKPNLPDGLAMLGSLFSSSLLLIVLLLLSGQSQPHEAQEGAPDVGRADSRGVLLLEALKMGILDSLGMDRKPRPTQKASTEELRKMYQLYREKVREMRGNSSRSSVSSMSSMSSMSTVLFPTTVELIKERQYPHSGPRMRWYRAVFHKNPSIQTEPTLTQAELKISRQVLDKPASPELKVRVNSMKPANSVGWTHVYAPDGADVSSTQDATLDITPEAETWMRTGGGEAMVVDAGIAVGGKDALKTPTVSLQLDLTEPEPARRTRLPRSNKEDVCDERGYCCRKSITVSFKDIGWSDWVVAPAEYTMHFCDGTCPHNYKPASMHTQVKSRLHQITKGGSPRPCCVPAAYEPMVLMHYDSRGRLKLTPFDDMIVSKCVCA